MLHNLIFAFQTIQQQDHRIHSLIVGASEQLINAQRSKIAYPALVLFLPSLNVTDAEISQTKRLRTYNFDVLIVSNSPKDDYRRKVDILLELEQISLSIQNYLTNGIYSTATNGQLSILPKNTKVQDTFKVTPIWEYTSDCLIGYAISITATQQYCPDNVLLSCNVTPIDYELPFPAKFGWATDGTTITCTPIVPGGRWYWRTNSQNKYTTANTATLVVPHTNTKNDSTIVYYKLEVAGVSYLQRVSIAPQPTTHTEVQCGRSYPYDNQANELNENNL